MKRQGWMLVEERLEEVLKIVNRKGKLTTEEAAATLEVSKDTVRRDFIRLEDKGLVKRSHGGIVTLKDTIYEYAVRTDNQSVSNIAAKQAIAKKALSLIDNGNTIILDGGTTTLEIARLLGSFGQLTVLTYGLDIAFITAHFETVTTILFGGIIGKGAMTALGPDTVQMIRNYHADKLFLSANAVNRERGLMTPNRMQADIKKELMKTADEIIVTADSSKIDKSALFAFCSLQEIDAFIYDEGMDRDFVRKLNALGIKTIAA